MAYMMKDGKGPYPCYAGEYCGNHDPQSEPARRLYESPAEARRREVESFANMRFGRPRSCQAGTSAEMAARGYVGLYLKEDQTVHAPGAILCDTPEELREPPPTLPTEPQPPAG